jgi:hypothetical protein
MAMTIDQARDVWLRVVNAHMPAARAHEIAAELFGRLGDVGLAEAESELAVGQRRACTAQLARHPEWTEDLDERPDAHAAVPSRHS